MSEETVVLIAEFERSEVHTGVRARILHLESALRPERYVAVNHGRRGSFGIVARLRGVRGVDRTVSPGEVAVIPALGSPPMMLLARRLRRRGQSCLLDVSDSLLGQFRERLRSRQIREVLVGVWMLAIIVATPRCPVSYISEADAKRDRMLNRWRAVKVVAPVAPVELKSLESMPWPASRVVLSGDFQSPHNRRGLRDLFEALAAIEPPLVAELYGPRAPDLPLPSGASYVGWAASLVDVYSGGTIVFVSNRRATGVPTKLTEAIASGRWAVVHESLREAIGDYESISYYSSSLDLTATLEGLWQRGRRTLVGGGGE